MPRWQSSLMRWFEEASTIYIHNLPAILLVLGTEMLTRTSLSDEVSVLQGEKIRVSSMLFRKNAAYWVHQVVGKGVGGEHSQSWLCALQVEPRHRPATSSQQRPLTWCLCCHWKQVNKSGFNRQHDSSSTSDGTPYLIKSDLKRCSFPDASPDQTVWIARFIMMLRRLRIFFKKKKKN